MDRDLDTQLVGAGVRVAREVGVNMAFSLTTPQVRARTKTQTRRMRWRKAKAGMIVMAVVKGMGLKKGEKVERLGSILFTAVRRERLFKITQEEVIKEGFPDMTPAEFVAMFYRHNGCHRRSKVTVIDFEYQNETPEPQLTLAGEGFNTTSPESR